MSPGLLPPSALELGQQLSPQAGCPTDVSRGGWGQRDKCFQGLQGQESGQMKVW